MVSNCEIVTPEIQDVKKMGLNVANGEMYPWADYTWNPLGGKCPHDCTYCYMKNPPACWSEKYKGVQRVWEKELSTNLSELEVNRREKLSFVPDLTPLIFVCSGNDLGAAPVEAQKRILDKCKEEPSNFYLVQTKNPHGLKGVENYLPPNTIIGTTLETNRGKICEKISNAPVPQKRARDIAEFGKYRKMVSIEPVMDFDIKDLFNLVKKVNPDFVSVGADSKGNNLPESTGEEIGKLIRLLKGFTVVKQKRNLNRILKANKNDRESLS